MSDDRLGVTGQWRKDGVFNSGAMTMAYPSGEEEKIGSIEQHAVPKTQGFKNLTMNCETCKKKQV